MFDMDTVCGVSPARGAPLERCRSPHVFGGRYRVEALLAQGGMGDVYLAFDERDRRWVAVKLLRTTGTELKRARARFAQEAATAQRMSHLRIVRTLDYGAEADGTLYLVMELLEGETLGARLREGSGVSPREAVSVAIQVLEALEVAHEGGVLHRDLKPENVFLTGRTFGTSVKLLDFGVAKSFHSSPSLPSLETTAGTVFGTPRYMSPEQARGGALDVRSDVYGVGVLLYQMLAGRPPFEDEDAVVVMARHIRDEPPPLELFASERRIPRSLVHIVHRALEKDPEDRFASATAFRRALAAALPSIDRLDRPLMNWLLNPGPKHGKARKLAMTGALIAALILAATNADLASLKPRYGMPKGSAEPAGELLEAPALDAPELELNEARPR